MSLTKLTFEGSEKEDFWRFVANELARRQLWKMDVVLPNLDIEKLGYVKGFAVALTDEPDVVQVVVL